MKIDDLRGNVNHYYKNFYRKMIGLESDGVLSFLWKYPHKVMEKPFKSNMNFKILELGYGEGEHLAFVKNDFSTYVATDIDKSRLKIPKSQNTNRIILQKVDAEKLPFDDQVFDRIIATCLIAHLKYPEEALSEWRRVLKPGGKATIYVALEPGLALRLFRKIFTAPKAKRLGFEGYNLYIARDHINDAFRVLNILAEVFNHDQIKYSYRPFFIRSWYLNLFCVVNITKHQ
jgi:ubiquinone/menaquinone biosynthesis C-methylase UbiE